MALIDRKYVMALFMIIFVSLCAFVIHKDKEIKNGGTVIKMGLAPCGEVCSYGGTERADGKFQSIRKNMNCQNIMQRMTYRNHTIVHPPPRSPPDDLYEAFTQDGYMPIVHKHYLIEFDATPSNSRKGAFSLNQIDSIIESTKKGKSVNTYDDDGCVRDVILKYKNTVQDSSSVVIGTLTPWLEAVLLANGASDVTTLEYSELHLEHPKLTTYSPYRYAELYLNKEVPSFDFGATYSSLEHSGLGRYGDPINPYGDLEAMAQIWCMMKPGGVFMVGVPFTDAEKGDLVWNAHRIYGTKRLEQMMANWNFMEAVQCNDTYHHIFMVLSKPV